MNTVLTISDFLEQIGARARFFDMGRRVVELPLETVRSFEHNRLPYPQPFQRHAWLGILFQHEDSQHHIWFLKLPLDEQGLLVQVARDDFLRRITETLGADADAATQQQALDDNPHGFAPREDRMAVFHAKVSHLLDQEASQFFSHAVDYFCGQLGYEQWNFVGLQGIADVAARLKETHHDQTLEQALIQAMPQLPETPFAALCSCLENEVLDTPLAQAIAVRLDDALNSNNAELSAACLRGLSLSRDRDILRTALGKTLAHELGSHVEVLAAIAGRAWEALEDESLRHQFLENLAHCEAGQQAFNGIMSDLLFMPGLRAPLLAAFRHPTRSDKLAEAIDSFMAQLQNKN